MDMEEVSCKVDGKTEAFSRSSKHSLDVSAETSALPDENPGVSPSKRLKRVIRIAVTGCCHGEMDKIYACAAEIERQNNYKFDLLICTGDYQAVRNHGDLEHMHVPPKYRKLQTFHQYYAGKTVAPILTLVVGGNHEASGYMQELPYGGWIAPRIFYLGHASVVSFAGLKIAGLSGIYNGSHYDMGHFEHPPFSHHGSVISIYHVRSVDVFRLKQLEPRENGSSNKVDFMISHDWPSGITDYGDVEELLRKKPHFAEDIKKSALGNPATMNLLQVLRPRYWLSSHLHCVFPALVPHEEKTKTENIDEFTHFLALDKPLPGRQFLQALEIEVDGNAETVLKYDPTWLAILKNTDKFTSISNRKTYMPAAYPPSDERWDYRPTEEEINQVIDLFGNEFQIPENFRQTAPPHEVFQTMSRQSELYYRNPQTTEFCRKLGIQDLNGMLCALSPQTLGTPFFLSGSKVDEERSQAEACSTADDQERGGDECFFIDKGSVMENVKEDQINLDSDAVSQDSTEESELNKWSEKILGGSSGEPRRVGSGIFKRRNLDIPEEE